MSKYFIHVRDGERLYGDDGQGVESSSLASMLPHIRRTVREIIDGEGGPSMGEGRVVEIKNKRGKLVLAVLFPKAYGAH